MQQIGERRLLSFLVSSSLEDDAFFPLFLLVTPLLGPTSSFSLFLEFTTGGATFFTAGTVGTVTGFSSSSFSSSSSKAFVFGKFTSISSQLFASQSSSSSSSSCLDSSTF